MVFLRTLSRLPLRHGGILLALTLPLLLSACDATSDAGSDEVTEEGVTAPPVVINPRQDPPSADPQESDVDLGEDPTTMEDTPGGRGAASLVMAGESFEFTPTLCSISETDVLVHGPGTGLEEGIPAFLDIDFYHDGTALAGRVRIDKGTDQQFESTESFYYADLGQGLDAVLESHGNSFVLEADFTAGSGSPIGPGTLNVDCDAAGVSVPPAEVPADDEASTTVQPDDCNWDSPALAASLPAVPTGGSGDLQELIVGSWQHTHFNTGGGYEALGEEDIRYVFSSPTALRYCQHVPGATEYADFAATFHWEGDTIVLPSVQYTVQVWDESTMVWLNSLDGSQYLLQRRS